MSEQLNWPIDRALSTGEREFRELADFVPVMIWRVGVDRQADWFNTPWLTFRGRTMAQEVGEGWTDGIHPEDLDRCLAVFFEAFDARRPYSMEYRLCRSDGVFRWIVENGMPFSREGVFAGYWGSGTDITDHRVAEQSQRVLINELNHRIKNVLAVVQAMAEQTFREETCTAASISCFAGRLRAFAAAQDQLVSTGGDDVSLRGLIEATIAPLDPGAGRIRTCGPSMTVCSEMAVTLTMALHELLTNAIKYGSLSNADGKVAIAWSHPHEAPGHLRLEWKERGGPMVHVPRERGFGTRFIERGLQGNDGGTSSLSFEPDGVHWLLDLPLVPKKAARRDARAGPRGLSA